MNSSPSAPQSPRPRIYQLMVRHFGNTNETRKPDGTIAENGCGKFSEINDAALSSLREMGFTHLWLTGALEHASATAYPGRPADDPDILKGKAGSPYAVKDYFDVSPDLAREPGARLEEFRALTDRCRRHGFRVLVDLVPNHVSRAYGSDVRPDLSFGEGDDHRVFFARDNNFYYLTPDDPGGGPPLKLPATGPGCDGRFPPETLFGRVTGNNVRSWAPAVSDWYETVKLNYGHDFTAGRDTSHLPPPDTPPEHAPDTWRKMDAVIAWWQARGIDGFRVDMAHIIPMEFWRWSIPRARRRASRTVFFMAEAYDTDPAKLTNRHVQEILLECGFDAVYDDASYDLLKQIYEGPKWANDLDHLASFGPRFHCSIRYAENHDEVRLANPSHWGGIGMRVGKPVTAVLFGFGRGPVMIYNGQETGEPAEGAAGFSGDDGRTTIFDYWSPPELAKWVNHHRYDGGRLSPAQRELRDWYGNLLRLCAQPAFARGEMRPLNPANLHNPHFGRLGDETVSGHWLYAFLRKDDHGPQTFLVAVNLHGVETMHNLKIRIPADDLAAIGRPRGTLEFTDRLATNWSSAADSRTLPTTGLSLPPLPPCSALFLEIK